MISEVLRLFFQNSPNDISAVLANDRPGAIANIRGSREYPAINGTVHFYQTQFGVVVIASITGLPTGSRGCDDRILAMHIHSGGGCTGNQTDPFASAGSHYNPGNCPHPYHAGDLPPLFGNKGLAWSAFLTNRFRVNEIIGKTVIIHGSPDDFTSQPAGNSGKKIACGVIGR